MARFFFLSLLFIYHAVAAHDANSRLSDNFSVLGKVVSAGGEVPFATICIKGTTRGVAADALGDFKVNNLTAGKYELVVSAVGYRSAIVEVEVHTEGSAELLVEMAYDNIGLEQVVISANRNERRRRDASSVVNSIQPHMFDRMQSVTLSEGLNFTPGVRMENNCQNCGFSQVRMNGLEGPYAQILINSRSVFSGLAGVYGLELIPVNMIERVEVIRGGGSAMFGSNAIAGTINLITKDPIYNSFSAAATYGGMDFDRTFSPQSPDYNVRLNGAIVSKNNLSGLSIYGFGRERIHTMPMEMASRSFLRLRILRQGQESSTGQAAGEKFRPTISGFTNTAEEAANLTCPYMKPILPKAQAIVSTPDRFNSINYTERLINSRFGCRLLELTADPIMAPTRTLRLMVRPTIFPSLRAFNTPIT